MYWSDYLRFLAALLVCMGFSLYASIKVRTSFAKWSGARCRSGMTGYDTAVRLLEANRVTGITVGRVKGDG